MTYGGSYLNSAHGNTNYGVIRTSLSASPYDYARANCAHCHEQHSSVGGSEPVPTGGPDKYLAFETLYENQASSFCFECHTDIITSRQESMINQYSYSYKFGGETGLTCPDNIKEAFQFVTEAGVPQTNCSVSTGSSHQLTDIRNFLKGKWGFDNTDAKVNPCSGCHNPHKAQKHNYPVGSKGSSPISLPSTHSGDWNVFGAEITERMNSYVYQSPYYYYTVSPTFYEPDGNSIADGSNLPNYVAFCTDCHNSNYTTIVSAQRNSFTNNYEGGYLLYPNWNSDKVAHGTADGKKNDTDRKNPYRQDKNYVLSCLDCHEPHGAPNGLLIRKEVNGGTDVNFTNWDDRIKWLSVCNQCHDIDNAIHHTADQCHKCHSHDEKSANPF